jgi:lipopolysaccharide transport system ATP-binding protein
VYCALTEEDTTLSVPIDVRVTSPVWFACSVESFRQGIGWSHLLQVEPRLVASTSGLYEIEVTIPSLPLSPGEYSLNLFLSERGREGTFVSLDVRSWAYGNDVTLAVAGKLRESVTILPLRWRGPLAVS